jgi:hypothetical protein
MYHRKIERTRSRMKIKKTKERKGGPNVNKDSQKGAESCVNENEKMRSMK